jgi:hypothetical protein
MGITIQFEGTNMSGYGAREARINRERSARVNLCGDCGCEVAETELLCKDCRGTMPSDGWYTDRENVQGWAYGSVRDAG